MDTRIGGRPLTRMSALRRDSISPSSRSSYRGDIRSRSPSPDIFSDSELHPPPRRGSHSPAKLRTAQEEAYFAYQAAREEHRNNAILADDSPYIPPAQLPSAAKPDKESSRRAERAGTNANVPYEGREKSRRGHEPRIAAQGEYRRTGRHNETRRLDEHNVVGPENGLAPSSGTDGHRQRRPSTADTERPERKKRGRNDEQDVILADDEPFNVPSGPRNPFNPERYPAYDENARRIGFDHMYFKKSKETGSDSNAPHYLPRTQVYPTGADNNATPSSEPAPQPRRALRTPPPLAPDPADDIDSGRGDEPQHGGRKRSPRRAAPLADAADIPDSTPHVREMLGLKPDQDVGLHALADPPPGEKPTYPYPLLIQLAILGSPKKRLTLAEIYSAIEDRFEWFKKTSDKAWQGSIRHTLSLKSIFRSVSRPITEPGKGNYWMVDHTQGDGNKRTRKRNPRPKKTERTNNAQQQQLQMMRREEEEETPTDEDYDSDLIPVDESNIDPQLRAQGYITAQGHSMAGSGYPAFMYNRQTGQNGHGRPVAVPFTPPTIGSGPTAQIRTNPAFNQPPLGNTNRSSTYQSSFGPISASSQPGPPYGPGFPSSNQNIHRQSYSPASSAPSPPLSTTSATSRQSPYTTNAPSGYNPSAASHHAQQSAAHRPSSSRAPASNPFGLRHVGPTQRAWHRSAGRFDDSSSGDDSD